MSKLTGTIISMSNLVSARPGDWKDLHDLAAELEAQLTALREAGKEMLNRFYLYEDEKAYQDMAALLENDNGN